MPKNNKQDIIQHGLNAAKSKADGNEQQYVEELASELSPGTNQSTNQGTNASENQSK